MHEAKIVLQKFIRSIRYVCGCVQRNPDGGGEPNIKYARNLIINKGEHGAYCIDKSIEIE